MCMKVGEFLEERIKSVCHFYSSLNGLGVFSCNQCNKVKTENGREKKGERVGGIDT